MPQRFAQSLLHHLYRGAALDHAVPEFAGATGGEGFGDAAYLDVAEPGFFHFWFEALGGFQCGDEVPQFAGGERVLARDKFKRRMFAGCVRQVLPLLFECRPPAVADSCLAPVS